LLKKAMRRSIRGDNLKCHVGMSFQLESFPCHNHLLKEKVGSDCHFFREFLNFSVTSLSTFMVCGLITHSLLSHSLISRIHQRHHFQLIPDPPPRYLHNHHFKPHPWQSHHSALIGFPHRNSLSPHLLGIVPLLQAHH